MATLLARPATQPPVPATRTTPQGMTNGPTPRRFLAGYVQLLLVPLAGAVGWTTVWDLVHPAGWAAATGTAAGWSSMVAAWLHHRGWRPTAAHLAAWAAPSALLAPLWALGSLSPAGLSLWGPVSTLLAIALVASYDPRLADPPSRIHRSR